MNILKCQDINPVELVNVKRNEIFSAAKHFLKAFLEPFVSMKSVAVCEASLRPLVQPAGLWGQPSLRFFPFLFQRCWRCSTLTPGCGVKHALVGSWLQRMHSRRSQVIFVWRQLLEVRGSQCPLSPDSGQLVIIKLLTILSCSLLAGRGRRLCCRLLIEPMGITLIWCLALVLIKWIASKVGHLYF